MKRLVLVGLLLAAVSVATAQDKDISKKKPVRPQPTRRVGKPSGEPAREATVLREVALSDLELPARVKLQFKRGRPIVGRLTWMDDTYLKLDTSGEPEGLPGKFRFRRADVVKAWEVSALTEDERKAAREAQHRRIEVVRSQHAELVAKRRAEEQAREDAEKAKQEELKKALDNVVSAEDEQAMRALLDEFPPPAWSEARANEIRDNWRLRDLTPSKQEARFLNVYDQWKRARDLIRIVDAKKTAQTGDALLLKYPTSAGWGVDRLDQINAKAANGEELTPEEADFRANYALWQQAVLRQAQKVAAEQAEKTEESEPEKTEVEKTEAEQ
jgi:hypothetical protein